MRIVASCILAAVLAGAVWAQSKEGWTGWTPDPMTSAPSDSWAGKPLPPPGSEPAALVATSASAPAGKADYSKIKPGVNSNMLGLRPFPDDNPWNKDISKAPVDPASAEMIAVIGANKNVHPDFNAIPYVVVTGTQKKVPVSFQFKDHSDAGPYPVPDDAPIEGGKDAKGDRHVLVIDKDNALLYETWASKLIDGSKGWQAGSGAIFDLKSNKLRPDGWTSADAAGLPIFPGLVRGDEVFDQKEIRHALRFTVKQTRDAHIFPARHDAGKNRIDLPPMGMRVRLKASVDISKFSPPTQVVLKALKTYGMILADNGSNWFITGSPDSRWEDKSLSEIKQIKGSNFEVIKMDLK